MDEYSTGIDARMKRELWAVLKQVTSDKAVFLTTRTYPSLDLCFFHIYVDDVPISADSMEEASYLATKVGIMSKRMLGMLIL